MIGTEKDAGIRDDGVVSTGMNEKFRVPLPLWALYWALAVVQLVAVCVVWHLVPDSIPAHWNAAGEIDRWGGRWELLIMPIFTVVFAVGMSFVVRRCTERRVAVGSLLALCASLLCFAAIEAWWIVSVLA